MPNRRVLRRLVPLAALGLLAACGRLVPVASPTIPPVASTALTLGVTATAAPALRSVAASDATGALEAFATSCPVIQSREDLSGLTQLADWREPCAAAQGWPSSDAANFFQRHFATVRVGDGAAFATGYFEPEILGSRNRRPGYDVPVYGMPEDLERCWREDIPLAERTGQAPLSRRTPEGTCVAYYTRAQIEEGALEGRAPVIGYAADPVELFFLQIQGSGRLRTPDGTIIRIGYAGQNGHSYTGIGGLMRERGLLGDGPGQYPGSMQGIMSYIRENPAAGAALMRENESWVFFRELTGEGPIGSIGVPVRGQSSVAVDPRFVPYGAPVLLELDRTEANGLWVAQDTGGAIRGANRFDTFWGAGAAARETAGGMSGRGQAIILLPRDAARRLGL